MSGLIRTRDVGRFEWSGQDWTKARKEAPEVIELRPFSTLEGIRLQEAAKEFAPAVQDGDQEALYEWLSVYIRHSFVRAVDADGVHEDAEPILESLGFVKVVTLGNLVMAISAGGSDPT
jgi:hypothetical protein